MTIFHIRPGVGNDAADGLTFSTAWKTITGGATTSRIAPGDEIRIEKSPLPSNLAVNAQFTNKSDTVTLSSSLTKEFQNSSAVDASEVAWTAAANVTTTTSTTRREGNFSTSMSPQVGFSTGVIAYYNLVPSGFDPGIDYSGFLAVSFWIRPSINIATHSLSFNVYDELNANSLSRSFLITSPLNANQWFPVALPAAGTFNAVKSIALEAVATIGPCTILLDNMFASTSFVTGLNLRTLIGKNTAGETWWAIRSVKGTTIKLDGNPQQNITATPRGYAGTTESVPLYRRDTFALAPALTNTTQVAAIQDSGSSGSPIVFSGGWTGGSTQDGETWFDGRTGTGYGLDINSKAFIKIDKLNFVRYYEAVFASGSDFEVADGHFNHNNQSGINNLSSAPRITMSGTAFAVANGTRGFGIGGPSPILTSSASLTASSNENGHGVSFLSSIDDFVRAEDATFKGWNNIQHGVAIATSGRFGPMDTRDNSIHGVAILGNCRTSIEVKSISTIANTSSGIQISAGVDGNVLSYTSSGNGSGISISVSNPLSEARWVFNNASIAEATKVTGFPNFTNFEVVLSKLGGSLTSNETYSDGVNYKSNNTDRNTPSGLSWEVNPTSSTLRKEGRPGRILVCRRAVVAGQQCTFSGAAKRSSSGITAGFRVLGGRVAGVPNDIIVDVSNVGTWNTYQTQFTPTEDGVIEVWFEVFGGTTLQALCDDVDITQ